MLAHTSLGTIAEIFNLKNNDIKDCLTVAVGVLYERIYNKALSDSEQYSNRYNGLEFFKF
jgi:hypothetical protein